MRLISAGLMTLGLAALVGCNTSPPGGSGNTRSSGTGRSATFSIHAPETATDLKQGETKEVKLTIDRGSGFHDDVTLKFEAPAGITVEPSTETVKATDDKTTAVKVTAAKDATVGEADVHVTGTAASGGNPTSVTLKVKVEKGETK